MKTTLNESEELIRGGRVGDARLCLQKLLGAELAPQAARRRLEPKDRARIIHLLRRAGASEGALEFAYDMVRGDGSELTPPSAPEKLEYAAALIFSGLEDEGLALLDEVPTAHSPLIHLYRAFGLFQRWEYERAEPELERFLARTDEADYFYRVGQINRASSLVYLGRLDEAEPLLAELIEKTKAASTGFLHSNVLELLAQLHLKRDDLVEAEKALEEAKKLAPDPQSLYRLFIDKWGYVLSLKRWRYAEHWHQHQLRSLIERARQLGHHETVRDLYLQTALASQSAVGRAQDSTSLRLLRLLAAGTPHSAYRARVERRLGSHATQSRITLAPGAFHEAWAIDAPEAQHEAELQTPHLVLPPIDRKRTRLFRILLSDAFSPWRVPRLYQALFPGRWYDARSARNLLHQSVFELRRGFQNEGRLPLAIDWRGDEISLRVLSPLVIDLETQPERSVESLLEARAVQLLREIERLCGDETFTKTTLEAQIDLPKRTLQRYLQALVQANALVQLGGGRSTRYRRALKS